MMDYSRPQANNPACNFKPELLNPGRTGALAPGGRKPRAPKSHELLGNNRLDQPEGV